MAISFYLKSPQKEKSPIYVSFRYEGKRLQTSTGWKIEIKQWDKKKGRPKPQTLSDVYQTTKSHLERVTSIIEGYYNEEKSKGIIPSPDALKKHLDKTLYTIEEKKIQEDNSVLVRLDEFIKVKNELLAEATLKKYRTLKKYLTDFAIQQKFKLQFENINHGFEDDFRRWLLNLSKRHANSKTEKGMLNDTISKYFGCLKSFMKWAQERNYHCNTAYIGFSAKKASKHEIIVLTEEELSAIETVQISKPLEKVRDLFLFMVFTGQRWGDCQRFSKSQLHGSIWKFKQQKTGKLMEIPMVGFAKPAYDVLVKYNFEVPKMVDPYFNREIKKICKQAGINSPVTLQRVQGTKDIILEGEKWEYISAHTARRTATTLLLKRGTPITSVMKLTGHTSLKTLMKYESTSTDDLQKALLAFEDKPDDKIRSIIG